MSPIVVAANPFSRSTRTAASMTTARRFVYPRPPASSARTRLSPILDDLELSDFCAMSAFAHSLPDTVDRSCEAESSIGARRGRGQRLGAFELGVEAHEPAAVAAHG